MIFPNKLKPNMDTVVYMTATCSCRGPGFRLAMMSHTGRVYTVYDVSAFALAGQRAHTSPAEEVIMDLITLGMTVDSLYRILHTMDARQCMETLAEYGEC